MKKEVQRNISPMTKQEIQRLRLSKNEIGVLRAVTVVPQKLVDIEKIVRLPHATVYETLLRLHERGLVISVGRDRKRRWLTLSESLLSVESGIQHKDVQVFEGKEQLLSLISELFVNHRDDRLLSFHGEKILEGWLSILNKKDIERRNIMIIDNEIIVERFVPELGYKKVFKSFPESWMKTMFGRAQITYLLPDDLFDTYTELMMFSDVAVVYETRVQRMTIFRDTETIKLFSAFFEMMRRLATKVNSEELFKMYVAR